MAKWIAAEFGYKHGNTDRQLCPKQYCARLYAWRGKLDGDPELWWTTCGGDRGGRITRTKPVP